ncbi:MAG: hypothetical protein ACK5LC_17840 [Coprobacillaceae bacterium]
MRILKRVVMACLSLSLIIPSISTVSATETDANSASFEINGITYHVDVEENEKIRISTVTDSNGNTSISEYNKDSGVLICDGEVVAMETVATAPQIGTRAVEGGGNGMSSTRLSYNVYTLSGDYANLVSQLTGLYFGFSWGGIISTIAGWLVGTVTLEVRISKFKSALKMSSGTYKGKYKYWTNVVILKGRSIILNENHSTYYQ